MATKFADKTTEAISKLLVAHPFYAVLVLQLLKIIETNQKDIPTAGTDGRRLFINVGWFGKLTLDERVFVLAHEVLHVIYQHPSRGKAYQDRGIGPDMKAWSHPKMNRACDYIINDMLIQGGMRAMPIGGLHNPQFDYTMLADDVYCKLPDEESDDEGNWDQHMPGKMPGALQRLVDQFCEPQVSWRDQIRMGVATTAGRDCATWTRPNRKRMALPPHVYMPGTADHRAGVVAIYGDTSGSVSDAEWGNYFGEMAAIVEELNPELCVIGSCDTDATEPEPVYSPEDVRSYVPVGGGGTHMPAIFDKLAESDIRPDVLVILTDGYTGFGEEPPYEVIWVMTSDVQAPYGRTIRINITG
jgi:predicted metal-dependent peptidase